MGRLLILAAYGVYAAFWVRFFWHALVWWRVARRLRETAAPNARPQVQVCLRTAVDVVFFGRLLTVNPALWVGEWVFHAAFLLVILRHLRFFLNPVPEWVWSIQTPGLIAGYILPCALVYVLVVRLFTRREKYAAPSNMFLLLLVLLISLIGLCMHTWFTPNLVDVKLFALGIVALHPAEFPDSVPFMLHFGLVLILIPLLPTHIFTAPLVMLEARKRERALHLVMHEK